MSYDSNITSNDVQEVFDTGLSDSAISTWIVAAEARVGDLPDHDTLTADRKDEITKFLAAALATAQDPRVDQEKHETATVSYGGERMGYLQIAAMLDPTDSIGSEGSSDAHVETFEVR